MHAHKPCDFYQSIQTKCLNVNKWYCQIVNILCIKTVQLLAGVQQS